MANPYIAELLGGNPNPAPLAIWHGTNLAEPEIACDYIQMYGTLWHMQPASFAFTRWLFNHSKVMQERAEILATQEAILWEPDGETRVKIGNQGRRLTANINDGLSKAIVIQRQNQRGQMVWPWANVW